MSLDKELAQVGEVNTSLIGIDRIKALVILEILPIALQDLDVSLMLCGKLLPTTLLGGREIEAYALDAVGLAQVGNRSPPATAHVEDALAGPEVHQFREEIHLGFLALGISGRMLPKVAGIDVPCAAEDREEELGRLLIVNIGTSFVFFLGIGLKHFLLGLSSRPLGRRGQRARRHAHEGFSLYSETECM